MIISTDDNGEEEEPDGVRYILYGRVLRFDKSLQLLFHVEEKVLEGKDHGKESQGIGSKRRRFPWFSACRQFLVEEKVPGRESQDIGCKIKGLRWFLVMHENTSDSWSVGWEQRRLPRFLPVMRKNTFDTLRPVQWICRGFCGICCKITDLEII